MESSTSFAVDVDQVTAEVAVPFEMWTQGSLLSELSLPSANGAAADIGRPPAAGAPPDERPDATADTKPGVVAPAGVEQLPLALRAHKSIDRLMAAGHPCVVAYSSGKDSSVLVNLVVTHAAARIAIGAPVPPILVIHSDTGVENPEVRRLADNEIRKIRQFGRDYGVPVTVQVGRPLLYTTWPVRVISGRALPSFPNGSRDCSVEWKVKVGRRLTVEAFKSLTGRTGDRKVDDELESARALADSDAVAELAAAGVRQGVPVVMTGVRKGESTARNAAISDRGELSESIWQDDAGRSFMSPILEWSADDVFEYMGYANAGLVPSYSDFGDTLEFYRSAGGSSCAVVGAMKLDDSIAKEKGGCGARSGCWTCVRVSKDTSLQTMIVSDPARYGYLQGLGTLRDFVANTQYDWSRRNFVGRTIDKDGCIAIQADAYSPKMLEEMLYYTLSLQSAEGASAYRDGVAPRFRIIGMREIVAIDALWSLYGLHPPFHALHIMNRVDAGDLRMPPKTTRFEQSPVPRLGPLFVGRDWESEVLTGDPVRDRMISSGIRDPILEMFEDSCGIGSRIDKDGTRITDFATEEAFDVDEDAAADFIGSGMADEMIERYHSKPGVMWTEGVKHYLGMGMITPAHGGVPRWHRIAKRTDWLQRHGLQGQVDVAELQKLLASQADARGQGEAEPGLSSDTAHSAVDEAMRQRASA